MNSTAFLPPAVVIYHKNCLDGLLAAYTFWNQHRTWRYEARDYNDVLDYEDYRDLTVFIVDFSFKLYEMKALLEVARRVVWLDHHEGALKELEPLVDNPPSNFDFRYSGTKSGAILAWDFLNARTPSELARPMPRLYDHVDDSDRGINALPNTAEVIRVFNSYPLEFANVHTVLERMSVPESQQRLVEEGYALTRMHRTQAQQTVALTTRFMDIGRHRVPVVMALRELAGSAAALLLDKYPRVPFAASYWDSATTRNFSLRSRNTENFDTITIANQYGGNGHKRASGFRVPRDHDLAKS